MKETQEDERLLTLRETLEYLRISRTTLYRFMDVKKIEGHKVGRLWRFYLGDLRSFVKGNQPTVDVNKAANKDEQS